MDLMEEIKKDNTALSKLTDQSAALAPMRKSNKRLPNFKKIRTCAASMYSTLQKGIGGTCSGSHMASLYMKPVESDNDESMTASGQDEVAFRVVLHHEFKMQQQATWAMEEADIRLLDSATASTSLKAAEVPLRPSTTSAKKTLRFQEPEATTKAISTSITLQKDLEEIIDLCASIQRLRAIQCETCLG